MSLHRSKEPESALGYFMRALPLSRGDVLARRIWVTVWQRVDQID
jgi:hypothetical protein